MKIQIEELGGKSAFEYCTRLMTGGHPGNEPLEVYRGDSLSYTIDPISWGARRRVLEGSGRTVPYEYKPMSEKDKERLKNRRKKS